MIPRIVHRIWLDEPMPAIFLSYGAAWRHLHPAWKMHDWRSTDDLPILRPSSSLLLARAQTLCPHDWKRWVADVVRLELLWTYGGVYVDTDVRPRYPLDALLAEHDAPEICVVGRSPQTVNGRHPITNAVMAATPQHPWIDALLQQLPIDAYRRPRQSLAQRIGPWMLTRVYDRVSWETVTVLPHAVLYGDDSPVRHMWNSARRRAGRGLDHGGLR